MKVLVSIPEPQSVDMALHTLEDALGLDQNISRSSEVYLMRLSQNRFVDIWAVQPRQLP